MSLCKIFFVVGVILKFLNRDIFVYNINLYDSYRSWFLQYLTCYIL